MKSPFYIDDIEALRKKLVDAERGETLMGRVWSSVRRRARNARGQLACPESLPILGKAIRDEEWCAAREAQKALQKLSSPARG